MINTETVQTQDGGTAKNGEYIYFIQNNKVNKAILRIGYHDKLYRIYKSPKTAAKYIRH